MPHIQPAPAFDVISVKKEHSHMSQIPAAAAPKNTTANNKTTKTATESKWIPLSRGRGQSPLSSTVATIIFKAEPSRNLCFPPNPHGLNLTLFLKAWWRITCFYSLIARVHFLMTYSSFFFSSSPSP